MLCMPSPCSQVLSFDPKPIDTQGLTNTGKAGVGVSQIGHHFVLLIHISH